MQINPYEMMKGICVLIAAFLYALLLSGCHDKARQPIVLKPAFRQDWSIVNKETSISVYERDSAGLYGGEYITTSVPLQEISCYRALEAYIWKTTNEAAVILRVINDFNPLNISRKDSLQNPPIDFWDKQAPYLLGEVCFIIQSNSSTDSVRFVYMKDRNDPASIVDSTASYR